MLDGRIMGLDVGDKTIGVAVSDLMGLTAQGVKTIKRVGKKKDIEALKEIIKERQVNKIVSGLPKNMNGTLGPQGEKVIKFCELLEEETGIKIEYWDERLSTVAAERTLIQGNVRRENRKGVIDMVAAVIILDMCLGVLGIYEVLLLCFQCQVDYQLIIIIVKNKRF